MDRKVKFRSKIGTTTTEKERMFRENLPLAEFVLRIITGKPVYVIQNWNMTWRNSGSGTNVVRIEKQKITLGSGPKYLRGGKLHQKNWQRQQPMELIFCRGKLWLRVTQKAKSHKMRLQLEQPHTTSSFIIVYSSIRFKTESTSPASLRFAKAALLK